jgi:carbonic anhydrase
MDTRLVEILEPALGIHRGEAIEIKNAGNGIGSSTGDVIRSLVGAVYMLGVKEIAVIGHTACGMANVDIVDLKHKMIQSGVLETDIDRLHLEQWIGTFKDEREHVLDTVKIIQDSPYLPKGIPIHGFMIDIETEELSVLVNGYEQRG